MSAAILAAEDLLGDLARRDEPLGPRTTYRVGGRAALFAELRSDADVLRVAATVAETAIPVLVIGKGSNLLVTDAGFPGLVVALGEPFAFVELRDTGEPDEGRVHAPELDEGGAAPAGAGGTEGAGGTAGAGGTERAAGTEGSGGTEGAGGTGPTVVRAGGAAALPVVARQTVRAGLTGFEWAVGVPGSIGGAVRMNAGGHGSEMAHVLRRVRLVDLRTGTDELLEAADLHLGYRHSNVAAEQLVLWAELLLAPGDRAKGEAELSEIVAWRRANQPGGQNAGSVFANPPGDSAGRLIDAAGCKGLRIGSAEVSTKHANFFQADAGGSADDVFALMREVQRRVEEATGIRLQPETRLVGFPEGDRDDG